LAREGFLKDKCGPRATRLSTTGYGNAEGQNLCWFL